ncbi:hypothetical protein GGD57_000230 [Rhizobium esperanzae]|uniref:HTH lysR-type domain-containing protein n=1 Tax=Rhizobium esperanzae TaxID=1967781 RepID=A0A7W6R004_9HYPH|nr:hypothetical protein [Rhizobium esperanzae]
MDRLEAMRILLAVVGAGSISAGSRRLNAPLPSVSRKVADLERHLGANLIVRTSRNLQLTDRVPDELVSGALPSPAFDGPLQPIPIVYAGQGIVELKKRVLSTELCHDRAHHLVCRINQYKSG